MLRNRTPYIGRFAIVAKRRTEGKWFGARYGRTEEKEKKRGGRAVFKGDHYVECYIVKGGSCVARAHIGVPISAD